MIDLVHPAAGRPAEEEVRPRGGSIGRMLVRVVVRVLVALGLALLALVFVEAWLPSVVVAVLGSWLPG